MGFGYYFTGCTDPSIKLNYDIIITEKKPVKQNINILHKQFGAYL